jgi:uncharacterized membrane protein YozB (DUF420 family)
MNTRDEASRNRLMFWLMAAVAAWGSLLSLGALLFGVNDEGAISFSVQPVRGLIAILTVAAFLLLWLATDWWRKRKIKHRQTMAASKSAKGQANASVGSE